MKNRWHHTWRKPFRGERSRTRFCLWSASSLVGPQLSAVCRRPQRQPIGRIARIGSEIYLQFNYEKHLIWFIGLQVKKEVKPAYSGLSKVWSCGTTLWNSFGFSVRLATAVLTPQVKTISIDFQLDYESNGVRPAKSQQLPSSPCITSNRWAPDKGFGI